MQNNSRSILVDYIRVFAIIWMVIFHLCYDLNYFGVIHINIRKDFFWYIQPKFIIALFFFAAGASLYFTYSNGFIWNKFWKRIFIIALSAATVSLVTYLAFPKNWIYFGVLHSIALCSILAVPVVRYPIVAIPIVVVTIFLTIIFGYPLPWIRLSHVAMDYVAPLPWLAAMAAGIWCSSKGMLSIQLRKPSFTKLASFVSKHSLKIYLLHQPILFVIVYLIVKI